MHETHNDHTRTVSLRKERSPNRRAGERGAASQHNESTQARERASGLTRFEGTRAFVPLRIRCRVTIRLVAQGARIGERPDVRGPSAVANFDMKPC
jgi:hypothetical protein